MLKVINENTKLMVLTIRWVCSKLAIKSQNVSQIKAFPSKHLPVQSLWTYFTPFSSIFFLLTLKRLHALDFEYILSYLTLSIYFAAVNVLGRYSGDFFKLEHVVLYWNDPPINHSPSPVGKYFLKFNEKDTRITFPFYSPWKHKNWFYNVFRGESTRNVVVHSFIAVDSCQVVAYCKQSTFETENKMKIK